MTASFHILSNYPTFLNIATKASSYSSAEKIPNSQQISLFEITN
jgi:hypothetical protein